MQRSASEYVQAVCHVDSIVRAQVWEDSWASDERARRVMKEVRYRTKPQAAAGLDAWPPCILRCLPEEADKVLLCFYQLCCQEARWPSEWLEIRTHLVPKTPEVCPGVEAFRPLSIMSIWYRAWSSWALRNMDQVIWREFDLQLRGGILGRDLGDMILDTMLSFEERILDPGNAQDIFVLSLDATKCFDLIEIKGALESMTQKGVPPLVVQGLGALWAHCRRYFSAFGKICEYPLPSCNGIPQGCALSVMACNTLVEGWLAAVRTGGGEGRAYIDDMLPLPREISWRRVLEKVSGGNERIDGRLM